MDITDITTLNREPAFPVYPCLYAMQEYDAIKDYEPGRILLAHYDMYSGKILTDLTKVVQAGDVVYIPLFGGEGAPWMSDRWVCNDASQHIEEYDTNLAILKEIAPHVRGILLGNAGPEMSFKHRWDPSVGREKMSQWMCEFVKETGDMVGEAGGTPVYGTIDWDLAVDCYFGAGALRDLVNEMGAIQICFCGFQLFGVTRTEYDHLVPRVGDAIFWDHCPKQEHAPWPQMTDYIRSTKRIWTGLNCIEGLERGFDIQMKERGFSAGVMGCEGGYHNRALVGSASEA